MKKIFALIIILIGIGLLSNVAMADDYYGPVNMVGKAFQQASTTIMKQLTDVGFKLLFGLSMINFIMIGYKEIQNGEIDRSIGSFVKAFIWLSFVVWVMMPAPDPVSAGLSNGANFIQSVVDQFMKLASTLTGGDSQTAFGAADVMNVGLNASHNLIASVAKATTGNVVNLVLAVALPNVTIFTALMLMVMNAIILLSCGYIAVKIFMVKLDAAIVITISPLCFALAGLAALKEQGMAPFKNLITIVFRIVILAAIVSTMKIVSDYLTQVLDTNAAGGVSDIWSPITAAIFGYVLLAFLAHKSDGIASAMSSGSSMFGSSDVAGAAAIGAAVGSALATGGASAVAGAAKIPQAMGDFMKTAEASISNASGGGSGGGGGGGNRQSGFSDFGAPGPNAPDGPARPKRAAEASALASLSGASPEVAKAASNAAGQGGNAQQINDAVIGAGGSPEQAKAISAAASGDATDLKTMRAAHNARPENVAAAEAAQSQVGSGPAQDSRANAGIGGGSNPAAKSDSPDAPGGQRKLTAMEHLANVNDRVAKEQSTVHSQVNVNAHDS